MAGRVDVCGEIGEFEQKLAERKTARCARCGADYFEYCNLGTWGCFQHRRGLDDDGRHLCCGARATPFGDYRSSGCQAADHTGRVDVEGRARPWTREDDVTVPEHVYSKIYGASYRKHLQVHCRVAGAREVPEVTLLRSGDWVQAARGRASARSVAD